MRARRPALPVMLIAAFLLARPRPLPAQEERDEPAAAEAKTDEPPAEVEAKTEEATAEAEAKTEEATAEGEAKTEEGAPAEGDKTEEPKPDEEASAAKGKPRGKVPADEQAPPPEGKPGGESTEPGEEDAGEKPKPKPKPKKPEPKRPKAQVPKDAREWEPIAVKAEGDLSKLGTSFLRLVKKVRSRVKEEPSPKGETPPEGEAKPKPKWVVRFEGERHRAKAAARSYKAGDGRILVVSVYPEDLRGGKAHVEARWRLSKADRLEGVEIAAVTVVGDASGLALEKRDSFVLRQRGIHFDESMPGKAEVLLASLEPWPGAGSRNAASVRLAEFGDRDIGAVNFSYSSTGVADGDK